MTVMKTNRSMIYTSMLQKIYSPSNKIQFFNLNEIKKCGWNLNIGLKNHGFQQNYFLVFNKSNSVFICTYFYDDDLLFSIVHRFSFLRENQDAKRALSSEWNPKLIWNFPLTKC